VVLQDSYGVPQSTYGDLFNEVFIKIELTTELTAAINAYVIWKTKNPDWKVHAHDKRRRFLLDLGQELIKPHVKQRIQKLTGMPAHTITAMKEDASLVTQHSSSMKLLEGTGSVGRCKLCPRNKDQKCKTKCGKCYSLVCSEHEVIKKDKVCKNCLN
ncbi:hypothetical protein C0J52_28336, partial [Blattella germanica]